MTHVYSDKMTPKDKLSVCKFQRQMFVDMFGASEFKTTQILLGKFLDEIDAKIPDLEAQIGDAA